MELRHYIIFGCATIVLQLFIYFFNRTLYWLFSGKISHKTRRAIFLFNYLAANIIVVLTITRIQPLFRLSAFILICQKTQPYIAHLLSDWRFRLIWIEPV